MRGLLSVSFGTSHADTRERTIDAIDDALRTTFSERAFYSAWTSPHIVAKTRERGEWHDTLEEAFDRLSADGIDDLMVSTTCLMNGGEMSKIERAVEAWANEGRRSACLAAPLLASEADRRAVARVICDEFSYVDEGDALLLMGHGSSVGGNDVYTQIQRELQALGRNRFYVATVEGTLTLDDVLPVIEQAGVECVYLAPLMIVAGDHAKNDLAGEDEDSWASRLEARGITTKAVLKGLGEYAGIRQLVCDHVSDALTLREVALRG